jgi:hypothetical protein
MELELDPDPISQEQDPSILEWARAQRACVDYETELPYTGNFLVPSNDDFDRYLHDPSDATILSAVSALIKERLAVDKDAALLLRVAYSPEEVLTIDPSATDSRMWIRDLKQELPVLQSDHQLDLLSFGNLAVPDFKTLRIPSEVTVEQNDEGFGWPTKYLSYPAQCDAQFKTEKLAVTREVLVHLQEAIRDAYIPEDGEKIEAEGMIRKQVGQALVSIRLLNYAETDRPVCHTTIAPTIPANDTLYSILTCKSSATSFI